MARNMGRPPLFGRSELLVFEHTHRMTTPVDLAVSAIGRARSRLVTLVLELGQSLQEILFS